jgi:hypothetical protein
MKGIDLHNACVGSVNSRADHSVRFSIESPELTPQQAALILSLHGVAARVLIQPLEAEEVEEVLTEKDTKTPSQRIRSRLYALWAKAKEKNLVTIPFDIFYLKETEKYMNSISERIDAIT